MSEKENSIKKWILKNGYPFEMKVANLFQKIGFKVSQSVLYKDEETNKYREIDIITHISKLVNGVYFNISFIIECKKSIDKPWLVFKNKDLINLKLDRFEPYATRSAEKLLKKTKAHKINNHIFPNISDAGYNVVIAFKEGKDLAYTSSESLMKASSYLIDKVNNSNLKQCNMYVPLIIIEGELYDAFLDVNEEIIFNQVDYSSILNTKVLGDEKSNIITIVSSSNLEDYIKRLKYDILDFFTIYSGEIEEISISNPTNERDICLGA